MAEALRPIRDSLFNAQYLTFHERFFTDCTVDKKRPFLRKQYRDIRSGPVISEARPAPVLYEFSIGTGPSLPAGKVFNEYALPKITANRLHKLTWLHGLEFLEANFDDHVFSRHAHPTFSIGAIVEGVGGYRCRGSDYVLPSGSLSLMNPEEPHTGHSIHGQLRYNMIYVSEEAVRDLLSTSTLVGFREVNPQDPSLALSRSLDRLGQLLNRPEMVPAWKLKVEETVDELLGLTFTRYGGSQLVSAGREHRAVRQVCELIDAHLTSDAHLDSEMRNELSIKDMAALVDLHPNYLIQSFTRAKGISPHAWLIWRKICRTKQLIAEGGAPLEVALALGFYDQAHFIKHFRRITGVTPGNLVIH